MCELFGATLPGSREVRVVETVPQPSTPALAPAISFRDIDNRLLRAARPAAEVTRTVLKDTAFESDHQRGNRRKGKDVTQDGIAFIYIYFYIHVTILMIFEVKMCMTLNFTIGQG